MSALRLANGRFRGITVEASKRFIGDEIRPLTGNTVTIDGNLNVNGDINIGLSLSATDTSIGEGTPEAGVLRTTAVGANAGKNLTTGERNVLVGSSSGISLTTGERNVLLGNSSGISLTTGGFNTLIGENAGATITDGVNNVFVGRGAGFVIPTNTSQSTFIGTEAGAFNTGNNCVLIGFRAGIENSDNNKLIIGNSNTSELITGNFSAETVELNGDVSLGKADKLSVVNFNRDIVGAGTSAGYIDIEVGGVPYKLQIYNV